MHRIVSISGGKDSTTAALTAISVHEKDDKIDFCFCDTGNEHSITYVSQFMDCVSSLYIYK